MGVIHVVGNLVRGSCYPALTMRPQQQIGVMKLTDGYVKYRQHTSCSINTPFVSVELTVHMNHSLKVCQTTGCEIPTLLSWGNWGSKSMGRTARSWFEWLSSGLAHMPSFSYAVSEHFLSCSKQKYTLHETAEVCGQVKCLTCTFVMHLLLGGFTFWLKMVS